MKFDELFGRKPPLRLGALAKRLFCSKCKGRRLHYELGVYINNDGRLWPERRRIEFQCEIAVPPSRE